MICNSVCAVFVLSVREKR